jgi:protein associated with RNAse G/E
MTTNKITAPEQITVRVLKYDRGEYCRWNATIAQREGRMIVLAAEFESDVQHHLLGDIPRGTRTIEYYWLDCWHNVFQFLDHEGHTRMYYCNVSTPATLDGEVLSYIDLDIDLLVHPDLSYELLDLEEFESNAERWNYSDEIRLQARASVKNLVSMIEERRFPFSEIT